MTLKKRVDRIESQCGVCAPARPTVILVGSPGGEVQGAILVHGGTIARREDETEKGFIQRAEAIERENQRRTQGG